MKVSCVIPVFNKQNYLLELYQSLKEQTYQNFELIFIDNNSTDYSNVILYQLARNDSKIKLLSEKEQGVSLARKKGVKVATGDYIMFVDADDKLPIDAIMNLVKEVEKYQSDIVIGNYTRVRHDGTRIDVNVDLYHKLRISKGNHPNLKASRETLIMQGRSMANKLYNKNIIRDDYFINVPMQEDRIFNMKAFLEARIITQIPESVYDYYTRENSASSIHNKVQWKDLLYQIRNVCDYYHNRMQYQYYEQELDYNMLSMLTDYIIRMDEKEKIPPKIYELLELFHHEQNQYFQHSYMNKKLEKKL